MQLCLLIVVGISSGIVVGGAFAALLSLLKIIPRFCQLSGTEKHIKLYQFILSVSTGIFSFMYFLEIDFKLHKYSIIFFSAVFGIIFGIVLGIFLGALASALAETLNVIPVAARKLRVKNYMFYIITSMVLGKIFGSLIYWLFLI